MLQTQIGEILRYAIAGAINTLIGMLLYVITIVLSGPYWIATFVSLIGGLCCGFILSRYFVFSKSFRPRQQSAYRYFLVIIGQYVLVTAAIGGLISTGISEILSYCYALPFIIILSYIIQKKWVF